MEMLQCPLLRLEEFKKGMVSGERSIAS
jgi:hypothetical protein